MSHILFLAGVAATGKSTSCLSLEQHGFICVEVEARSCWGLPGLTQRQRCFADAFKEIIAEASRLAERLGTDVVTSNSMATVYAYTLAMLRQRRVLEPGVAAVLAETYELALQHAPDTVLLAAEEPTIRSRIQHRMRVDMERSMNIVEEQINIHMQAQRELLLFAKNNNIPVIWTDELSPENVAEAIASLRRR